MTALLRLPEAWRQRWTSASAAARLAAQQAQADAEQAQADAEQAQADAEHSAG